MTPHVEEDETAIISVSDEALDRINTAQRQIAALLRDLLEEQHIEPCAVFLALGRVAASYPQWAVRTTNEPGLRKRLRSEVCPPPSCCAAAFDVSEGRC